MLRSLLASIPRIGEIKKGHRLHAIEGNVPSPTAWPQGCRFHPRCSIRRDSCATDKSPVLETVEDERAAMRILTVVKNVPVMPVAEAQRGTHYIRVRAQSRVRELPPVVGGLFFFVPEVEFFAENRSARFPLNK